MFQKSDKLDDYITLKQLRAKTTYLVKSSKTNSWKTLGKLSLSPSALKLILNKYRAKLDRCEDRIMKNK